MRFRRSFHLPLLALFSVIPHVISSGVTNDSTVASGQTFDYIVVGAGLAGTTVAARLAENSSLTILVIEAGADDRTNPEVYDIYAYSQAFGGPLDWAWGTDGGRTIRGYVAMSRLLSWSKN